VGRHDRDAARDREGQARQGSLRATIDVNESFCRSDPVRLARSPIDGTANAHIEAHGPLGAVDLALHAGLDAATLDVHGQLAWGLERQATLHLDAGGVDLRKLTPGVRRRASG